MENKSIQMQRQTGFYQTTKRQPMDYYITPTDATNSLLANESFIGNGWEPACGNGAISRLFPTIYSSDIRKDDDVYGDKGIDFLKENKEVDFIITNPPFSLALEFAEHSLKCAKKVALLCRLQFLEGKKRGSFFEKNPPKTVYVFSNRINCNPPGRKSATMMCFAWFVWEREWKGDPVIKWIRTDKIPYKQEEENDKK